MLYSLDCSEVFTELYGEEERETKHKQTHRLFENELKVARGGQEDERKGLYRDLGMDVYTVLYLKWITNKDLLYSTGYSARCYVAAWMGGEFGGEWIHVYGWLNPFPVLLKLSQHCWLISYTPIQNKKFSLKKKKTYILGIIHNMKLERS